MLAFRDYNSGSGPTFSARSDRSVAQCVASDTRSLNYGVGTGDEMQRFGTRRRACVTRAGRWMSFGYVARILDPDNVDALWTRCRAALHPLAW